MMQRSSFASAEASVLTTLGCVPLIFWGSQLCTHQNGYFGHCVFMEDS